MLDDGVSVAVGVEDAPTLLDAVGVVRWRGRC